MNSGSTNFIRGFLVGWVMKQESIERSDMLSFGLYFQFELLSIVETYVFYYCWKWKKYQGNVWTLTGDASLKTWPEHKLSVTKCTAAVSTWHLLSNKPPFTPLLACTNAYLLSHISQFLQGWAVEKFFWKCRQGSSVFWALQDRHEGVRKMQMWGRGLFEGFFSASVLEPWWMLKAERLQNNSSV